MFALTPAERRGAWVVVALLAIGACHDLWRARTLERTRRSMTETGAPRSNADARASSPDPAADSAAERTDPAPGTVAPRASGETPAPIDLNRATAHDLDALPGVGPVLAGRIVTQRTLYGPYRRVEDLLAVRGIGPRLLERVRPHVIVRSGPKE